jgi:hypothetical protein
MTLIASPSGNFGPINLSANGLYAGVTNSISGELISLPGPTLTIPLSVAAQQIFPSPDGSLVAVPIQPNGVPDQYTNTGIYRSNGSLVTTVSGNPVGWIDSNSLLVNTYINSSPPGVYISYNTSVIYDASGNVKLTFPQGTLPLLQYPQFLNSTEVYSTGSIYSLVTGAVEWNWPNLLSGPSFSNSAVLGSSVIFTTGGRINFFPR